MTKSIQKDEASIVRNYQKQMQVERIKQAELAGSKQMLKTLYSELFFKDLNPKSKSKMFVNLMLTFVQKNIKNNSNEGFNMRKSNFFQQIIPETNEFVQNSYLIYGADFLQDKTVSRLFKFHPDIKWVNSSSCLLHFQQKQQGWEGLINNCLRVEDIIASIGSKNPKEKLMEKPFTFEEKSQMRIKYEAQQELKNEFNLIKDYIELQPYYELGFKRRIFMRNSTKLQYEKFFGQNTKNQQSKAKGQTMENARQLYAKYQRVKSSFWSQIEQRVKPADQLFKKKIHQSNKQTKHYLRNSNNSEDKAKN